MEGAEEREQEEGWQVRAIIHNRDSLLRRALGTLHCSTQKSSLDRNNSNKSLLKAEIMWRKHALWRGYLELLKQSPAEKRERADRWREKHLQAVMFGAWVRFCIWAREDKRNVVKAAALYELKGCSYGLKKFSYLVSMHRLFSSHLSIASIFHKLICFKKSFIMLREIPTKLRASSRKSEFQLLDMFMERKRAKLHRKYFAALHVKSKRRADLFNHKYQSKWHVSMIKMSFDILLRNVGRRKLLDRSVVKYNVCKLRNMRSYGLEKLISHCHNRKFRRELCYESFTFFHSRLAAASTKPNRIAIADVCVRAKFHVFKRNTRAIHNRKRKYITDDKYGAEHHQRYSKNTLFGVWWERSKGRTQRKMFQDFQVSQHQRFCCAKLFHSMWQSWCLKHTKHRLRKIALFESLKLHYFKKEFKMLSHAIDRWKMRLKLYRHRKMHILKANDFWRFSRLSGVLSLLQCRCDDIRVTSSPTRTCSALWRSELGDIGCDVRDKSQRRAKSCLLFYSVVSRSHLTVAKHCRDRRLMTSLLKALISHSARCGIRRNQLYRAIWFWKYWRVALALKRWRARMMLRRERRDMLRIAALDYKASINKTMLRKWMVSVSPVMVTDNVSKYVSFENKVSLASQNLLRSCFVEWRQLVVHKTSTSSTIQITDQGRYLPTSSSSQSCQPSSSSHERLIFPNTISCQKSSNAFTNERNNLLLAKPRIPLHLLLPDTDSMNMKILPNRGVEGSTKASTCPPDAHLYNDSVLPEGDAETSVDRHAAIFELESVIEDVASLAKSLKNCPSTAYNNKQKRVLAHYMLQCANEIDRLGAL